MRVQHEHRAFVRPSLGLTGSIPDICNDNGSVNPNTNGSSHHIRNILELVDFDARHNPDHTFCLQEVKDAPSLMKITFKQLAQAVRVASAWLCQVGVGKHPGERHGGGVRDEALPVGLLMGSDIGIFINLLALMRLGIPVSAIFGYSLEYARAKILQVALLSARLSPVAIAHLVESVNIRDLLVTSHTTRVANAAMKLVSEQNGASVDCVQVPTFTFFLEHKDSLADYLRQPFHVVDELDRSAIILHSSGSTGLPKPIYHTHKYLLSYAGCHIYPEGDDVSGVCASTLPLFHVSVWLWV